MSDIPMARDIITYLISSMRSGSPVADHQTLLEEALSLMTRRSPARPRSPVKSQAVDEGAAEAIRDFAYRNPTMPLQQIATLFQTNMGRVSEAMQGDR